MGPGDPRGENKIFSKVVPRPTWMLKQVFLARFEPVVACFGALKASKWAQFLGPKMGQKRVKNTFVQKRCSTFGVHKQDNRGHVEPVLAPLRFEKALKMGHFANKDFSKGGQNVLFRRLC